VTRAFLPYGRQHIDDADIAAVAAVLRGDWLTTGPAVERFERHLCDVVGARHSVVCNSGTAALYLAARAAGLEPGAAVIVPAVTFAASASAFVLAGYDVLLADVDPDTGLMGPEHVEAALARAAGKRVRGVVPVHLQGQVRDPEALAALAAKHGLTVIEDACHALGSRYGAARHSAGACAHAQFACFSFHPVKTIAMGEGGAVTTNDAAMADAMRRLRSHGITREAEQFTNAQLALGRDGKPHSWYYELSEISHNLRASDINCALADSQLGKLTIFAEERRRLVRRYREQIAGLAPAVRPVPVLPGSDAAWHLMCVLIDFAATGVDRDVVVARLRAAGIGTQVHYIPLHLQPYYRQLCGALSLPGAEAYYARILSLPLYYGLSDADVDYVTGELAKAIAQ